MLEDDAADLGQQGGVALLFDYAKQFTWSQSSPTAFCLCCGIALCTTKKTREGGIKFDRKEQFALTPGEAHDRRRKSHCTSQCAEQGAWIISLQASGTEFFSPRKNLLWSACEKKSSYEHSTQASRLEAAKVKFVAKHKKQLVDAQHEQQVAETHATAKHNELAALQKPGAPVDKTLDAAKRSAQEADAALAAATAKLKQLEGKADAVPAGEGAGGAADGAGAAAEGAATGRPHATARGPLRHSARLSQGPRVVFSEEELNAMAEEAWQRREHEELLSSAAESISFEPLQSPVQSQIAMQLSQESTIFSGAVKVDDDGQLVASAAINLGAILCDATGELLTIEDWAKPHPRSEIDLAREGVTGSFCFRADVPSLLDNSAQPGSGSARTH
jgi:hypothetical protein